MSSLRQTKANQRNARRFTGPKTEEGRRASSLNALKHGFRSDLIVLPSENQADFQALHDAFAEEAQPQSTRDLAAVRKIAACEWRLRRAAAIEAEMFNGLVQKARAAANTPDIDALLKQITDGPLVPQPRAEDLSSLSDLAIIGRGFLLGDIKGFSALARYEASLERQYQNAWRELDFRPDPGPNGGGDDEEPWGSSLDLYNAALPTSPRDTEPAAERIQPPPAAPAAAKPPSQQSVTDEVPVAAQTNPIPQTDNTPAECLKPARLPLTPNTSHLTPASNTSHLTPS